MNQPWKHKEVIGQCTLYLGDCMDIMPALGEFDAVVTDPPYGIGMDGRAPSTRGKKSDRKGFAFKGWDQKSPDDEVFSVFFNKSAHQIIWGGNYFQKQIMKMGRGWLYWDKGQKGLTMSDGELAYTSLDMPLRAFVVNRAEIKNDGSCHPTQKPIALMKWCINHLPDNTQTILDPFMGSGTTLVACAKMGRKGTGIELDPEYFDIACERVQKAYDQPDMFVQQERVKPPENLELFGGGK